MAKSTLSTAAGKLATSFTCSPRGSATKPNVQSRKQTQSDRKDTFYWPLSARRAPSCGALARGVSTALHWVFDSLHAPCNRHSQAPSNKWQQ